MKVAAQSVVSLDYSLHLGDGNVIDRSDPGEPLVYLQGAGQIVPGLENAVAGMDVGESKHVVVAPDEGYGERDLSRVQVLPEVAFGGQQIKAGDELVATDDDGDEVPLRIVKVENGEVTVDFNHPLAGSTLHFDITVRDVRPATKEELAHGHVHGDDGHHHH